MTKNLLNREDLRSIPVSSLVDLMSGTDQNGQKVLGIQH